VGIASNDRQQVLKAIQKAKGDETGNGKPKRKAAAKSNGRTEFAYGANEAALADKIMTDIRAVKALADKIGGERVREILVLFGQ